MRFFVMILALFTSDLCNAQDTGAKPSPQFAESNSFVVQTYREGPSAEEVLNQCMSLRTQFHGTWMDDSELGHWKPRCQVVVHPTRTSYSRAVGAGAARTNGSSLIRQSGRIVVDRRIDLVVGVHGQLPALPHELTHVILADRFAGREPPLWADEGLAMLADSAEKQSLHHRDCVNALQGGRAMRVTDLLRMRRFPSPQQVPTFYGQSLSLARFLAERYDSSRFLPFVEQSMTGGYDNALREVYGINGIPDLEIAWRKYAINPPMVRAISYSE